MLRHQIGKRSHGRYGNFIANAAARYEFTILNLLILVIFLLATTSDDNARKDNDSLDILSRIMLNFVATPTF